MFGYVSSPLFIFLHVLIRKTAHVTVYALLSLFWFRAQRGPRSGWQPGWALLALLVSLLVAIGDEFHQSFLLSRTGTPWDVLLDSMGALLMQAWLALRARRRPHSPA